MFSVWRNARTGYSGLRGLGALKLSLNSFTQYVGQSPTYTIEGAAPNADIYWSSLKNGQSTGEVNAYYGHKTDGDGKWSATTGPWAAGYEGNWWKTARVGDESSTVQFQILPTPATTTPTPAPLPAPWNTQPYPYPYYPQQPSAAYVPPSQDTISVLGFEVPKLVVYAALGLIAYKVVAGGGRR